MAQSFEVTETYKNNLVLTKTKSGHILTFSDKMHFFCDIRLFSSHDIAFSRGHSVRFWAPVEFAC